MVKYLLFYYFLCSRISVLSLIFITKIDGSYLNPIPYIHYIIYTDLLLVLLLLCLCKSFKQRLFFFASHAAPSPDFSAKADAKVQTFRETPKHFTRKFENNATFSTFLTELWQFPYTFLVCMTLFDVFFVYFLLVQRPPCIGYVCKNERYENTY